MSQTMPWYPLYHEAFDLDTGSWSLQEIGALMRLMNHQWANGSVPDDQAKLRVICRAMDPDEWIEIWKTLEPKFEPVASAPGHLVNRRLAIEHERQTRKSNQARAAALTRHHGKGSKINPPDADATDPHVPETCDLDLEARSKTEEEEKREASPPLPDALNREAWDTWLAYRRESRMKKWVPRTVKTRTRMLAQFTHAEQQAIIDHSISNGYSGLFPDGALGGGNGRRVLSSPAEEIERATGVKRL